MSKYGKMTIELNGAGVRQLLRSPELEQLLGEKAAQIRGRCGDGYYNDTKKMKTRVIASVATGNADAMRDNARNNTILKHLH